MASTHGIPSSRWRAVIESAFFANSVRKTDMSELYSLAKKQPAVMATSEPFYKPSWFGLPKNARILISNDSGVGSFK